MIVYGTVVQVFELLELTVLFEQILFLLQQQELFQQFQPFLHLELYY